MQMILDSGTLARRMISRLVALRPSLRLVLVLIHVTALAVMWQTETILVAKVAYLLAWVLLNSLFLTLVRRPVLAAALSLVFVVTLIRLSQFKHEIVFTTLVFVDVMIIDRDTFHFLSTVLPVFKWAAGLAGLMSVLLIWALWRAEVRPVRRRIPALAGVVSLGMLSGMSLAVPAERWEIFYNGDYVSKFFRSGVEAVSAFLRDGLLEADVMAGDRLSAPVPCVPPARAPHIVLIHDESSFDIRVLPGVKAPPGYGTHFASFDGVQRTFLAESSGGASWFAEYNVLTGLSSRSFGSFSYFLTRIAAGRVERGLPRTLVACGYRTVSLYPSPGGFMGARQFQESTGIQQFRDHAALGGRIVEPDAFYYDAALREFEAQRDKGPLFAFVYLAANHFPWDVRGLEEPGFDWQPPGNAPVIDEYLRRQAISERHYRAFVEDLQRRFPGEPFLIVRYGDHQPSFAATMLEPSLGEAARRRALLRFDARYFATYYAIDALNFSPVDMSDARSPLDAPYLPLVVLKAAGVPLDPSFAEQARVLNRCNGIFYGCRGGAEARRLNRLLIDDGQIKGM